MIFNGLRMPEIRSDVFDEFYLSAMSYIASRFKEPVFLPRLIEVLKDTDGKKLIEIGCGVGMIAFDIASRHPNMKVLGIDSNEEAIKLAKKLHQRKNLVSLPQFHLV